MKFQVMKNAKKLVVDCLNVKSGEVVLIVTDTNELDVADALSYVAYAEGAEVLEMIMAPRTHHAEELPKPIANAMKVADVILAPTTFSVTHTKARNEASEAGARILILSGMTEKTLTSGGIEADFAKIKPLVEETASLLAKSSIMRVTTKLGTNLKFALKDKPVAFSNICHERGSLGAPPAVMACVAPLENSAEGIMMVDMLTVPYCSDGQITHPIKVTLQKGRIISIQGDDEAQKLKKTLKSYNHPNLYCPVQIGIGLNPLAIVGANRGAPEDEAKYGTFTLGFGEGRTFGSRIRAPAHIDLVMKKPTIELDGKVIQRNGKLLLDNACSILGSHPVL